MSDSADLIALRKSLGGAAEALSPEAGREVAQTVIRKILVAVESGVCPLGPWERRCLAGAITSLRGGRSNEARSRARRALWPEENRRGEAIARFTPGPGMSSLDELKREFEAALALPMRAGVRDSKGA